MAVSKYFLANRKLFLYTLLWQLAFFAAGVVMVLIINYFFNEDQDYACMGTLLALCGILAGGFMQASGVCFRLTVLMGETRRNYLLCSPLVTAALTLQGWLTAFCLNKAETLLYNTIYPGYVSGLPVESVFKWWAVALSVVIFSIVCLFFGAVQAKFGQKGAIVIWMVIWGSCMLLPQAVDRYQEGGASLVARMGGLIFTLAGMLTPVMWCGVGAAALLAMLGFSVWVYRKAEVRI